MKEIQAIADLMNDILWAADVHLVMTKNPFFKCGYKHLSGNVPANEYAINQGNNNTTEFLIPTYTASGDSSTQKIFKMSSLFTSLFRL